MTNPNDIIDAYDELVRLVTILGPDTVRNLLDRAIGRSRPLHLVGETGPEPVKLATGGIIRPTNKINVTVNDDPDVAGRIYKAITGKEPKPPVNDGDTPADGCPWCTADVRPRLLWRHVNTAHRDDLQELYVEDGIKGIQTVFDLPYQTAYGWAQRIDGEAA